MSLFSSSSNKASYGAIIDIGSGSVLVAIVKSDPDKVYPEIIWSKREYAPLRNTASISDSAKNVMSSLVSALMLLESEGRKVFKEKTGANRLPKTQVTIAAPWSYTTTKSINYNHTEPFTLSNSLIDELLRTAHKKVEEEIKENESINQLGLSIIARGTIGLQANGYNIISTNNQETKTLKIVEANAVAQDYLIKAIQDASHKVLPESELSLFSFMLIYYSMVKELFPETHEHCLVDITYEATEIGIVRDGLLTHTTHTPFGSFSLAREIAAVLSVPLEEAYGYLKHSEGIDELPESKRTEVKKIFDSYQAKLAELLNETGDTLAIPKKMFLHVNLETEVFFSQQVEAASKLATKSSHAVYSISGKLAESYPEDMTAQLTSGKMDTALLISCQFFHTERDREEFEHP